MDAELFTDGIGEITVGRSIVRVDLFSLSPTERDASNAPKRLFRQRLIFSVEAFANSVEVMQKALQGLVDAGAIRRSEPSQAGSPAGQPISNDPRSPNLSGNFR